MNSVQLITVSILPLLFAITVHEVAHGWMANRLGDPTARMLGRLTLNPLKHIDPLGTVLVPALLILMNTGFVFGWAKPIPVTERNLRRPKQDMAWVALAGPLSNLLMALLWALVARLGVTMGPDLAWIAEPLYLMGQVGITINLLLMVLNMLPLPPLDGGRVAVALLPGPLAWKLSRVEPFGFIVIVILLYTQVLGKIIGPPIEWLESIILNLFSLI
ncbi:MAG: peptidase [Gammaproteobacteria bacterium RBG_16_57_12]|nr:MAG: peptidase [Gammaproteobacteria bacterium RBG_16_57_12]